MHLPFCDCTFFRCYLLKLSQILHLKEKKDEECDTGDSDNDSDDGDGQRRDDDAIIQFIGMKTLSKRSVGIVTFNATLSIKRVLRKTIIVSLISTSYPSSPSILLWNELNWNEMNWNEMDDNATSHRNVTLIRKRWHEWNEQMDKWMPNFSLSIKRYDCFTRITFLFLSVRVRLLMRLYRYVFTFPSGWGRKWY